MQHSSARPMLTATAHIHGKGQILITYRVATPSTDCRNLFTVKRTDVSNTAQNRPHGLLGK